MTDHVLEVDGYFYTSEERAFEGVMFQVHVTETASDLIITDVTNLARDAAYLKKFKMGSFKKEVSDRVQRHIDYLKRYATSENKTLADLLDEWQRDFPAAPRIQLLDEV